MVQHAVNSAWRFIKSHFSEASALVGAAISRKASSDYIYVASAHGIGVLASFLTALLLTKRLGLEQFGVYALVVSISAFIAVLAEIGIGQTATRYASIASSNSDPEQCNEIVAWSINVRIAFAFGSLVIGLLLSDGLVTYIWTSPGTAEFIPYAFLMGLAITLQQCANAYFYTGHDFRFISGTVVLNSVLTLAGALVLDGAGLLSLKTLILWSITVSCAVFVVVCATVPWHRIYNVGKGRRYSARLTLMLRMSEKTGVSFHSNYRIGPHTFAFYLIVSSLIVAVFTRLDVWMIAALMTEADLGKYKLATYFAFPLSLALGALNTTLWPRASRLQSADNIRIYVRNTLTISALFLLLSALYALAVYWLPALIFPEHAMAITGLAMVLCVRYALAMLIAPVAIVGYSLGMSQLYVVINVLQMLTILTLNFYLIDSIGLYAPALSLIVTELISIAVIGPVLRSRMRSLFFAS